jgi:two-component system chemotaxis response regulator CheY
MTDMTETRRILVVATDGLDGIDRFRRACEVGQPFALVCLDIMMPGMDGHRTLTALRRMERDCPGSTARAHIVMLTSLSSRTAVERAVAAGCDGYLVKPFAGEDVLRKLVELGITPRENAA